MNYVICRFVVASLTFFLIFGSVAHADVISTGSALQMELRQEQVDRVDTFLARDDVRDALIARGVNPADATLRIGALTDQELQRLAVRIDNLPAGGTGVIEVVGIVAIVLLVLELLGVTDVFTRI
ncbi:MAG: PA2779 family protein [Pseudomonadales bacterium]|nr:PA2779 family protein [Pseudomonadales bacterium]